MRVTNKQMVSLITQGVATSSELLLKAQERVALRKLINRPSDDPIGMSRVLDYRRKIASIDQYTRNITSAKTRVEIAATKLEEVHGLLSDAKTLAVSQSSQDDALGRESAAIEVAKIYDWIRDLANTRLGGKYIFAGHNTDTKPFTNDASYNITYDGDSGEIYTILGEGVKIKTNAHGDETFTGFGVTGGVNIFNVLRDLKDGLETEPYDPDAIGDQIGELTKGITQIEKVLSKQATTFKRLEQTEGRWANLKQNFEKVLSATEDADIAQVVVELRAQENAYEIALASAANVLKRSLLDFLR